MPPAPERNRSDHIAGVNRGRSEYPAPGKEGAMVIQECGNDAARKDDKHRPQSRRKQERHTEPHRQIPRWCSLPMERCCRRSVENQKPDKEKNDQQRPSGNWNCSPLPNAVRRFSNGNLWPKRIGRLPQCLRSLAVVLGVISVVRQSSTRCLGDLGQKRAHRLMPQKDRPAVTEP